MGVVINPNSELGRELAKWEQHPTQYTNGLDNEGNPIQPGNPYQYRPYPSMLYLAHERQGKAICMVPAPHPHEYEKADQFERAILAAETFNASCQKIVRNADEMSKAKNEGWRESPTLALEALEARRLAVSTAAAETAFHAKRMTAQARSELAAADASTHEHVVDVKPARKRGRPTKGQIAVGG